jgi:hypothetical protein
MLDKLRQVEFTQNTEIMDIFLPVGAGVGYRISYQA